MFKVEVNVLVDINDKSRCHNFTKSIHTYLSWIRYKPCVGRYKYLSRARKKLRVG